MEEISRADIRLAAMNILAGREHLVSELASKLARRFGGEHDFNVVLAQLQLEGLLDDRRFAEAYVYQRSNKGYGPQRIRLELRERGAAADIIEEAMAASEADWVALAQQVRVKKFGSAEPQDFKERSRQLRFLQYRGFNGDSTAEAFALD